MSETTTLNEKPQLIVTPFAVEADHPRNSELLLQSIPNARLRSAFDGMKPAIDRNGRPHVPVDQALTFASFPRTPGMQIHVNPKTCEYKIIDPLHKNEAACEALTQAVRARVPIGNQKFGGAPPQEGKLDVHQMKTLCRELFNIVEAGEAKCVRGDMPTMDDIDKLPGRYLLNPGSRVANTQPKYEDDFPAWVDNLSHSGG